MIERATATETRTAGLRRLARWTATPEAQRIMREQLAQLRRAGQGTSPTARRLRRLLAEGEQAGGAA